MRRKTTLIWAPQNGDARVATPDPNHRHHLLIDDTAGNGQSHSFDAWDELLIVADNNSDPNEHAPHITDPAVWRRFPSLAIHANDAYAVLYRNSSSTWTLMGGGMGVREIWGVRYE